MRKKRTTPEDDMTRSRRRWTQKEIATIYVDNKMPAGFPDSWEWVPAEDFDRLSKRLDARVARRDTCLCGHSREQHTNCETPGVTPVCTQNCPCEQFKNRSEIVEALMNAQAELQSGLGVYRMGRERLYFDPYVERRMQASLAMQHELLAALGHPMYQPAQMPEGWMPA